jgi:hypothetical protein
VKKGNRERGQGETEREMVRREDRQKKRGVRRQRVKVIRKRGVKRERVRGGKKRGVKRERFGGERVRDGKERIGRERVRERDMESKV